MNGVIWNLEIRALLAYWQKACHIKWSRSLNKSSKNWKDVYTAAGQITPKGMVKMWTKTRVVWVFLSDKEYSQKHPEAFTPHNPALFGPYNTRGGADLPQSFFLFSWTPGWSDLLKNGLRIKFLQKSSIWDPLLVSQSLSSREIAVWKKKFLLHFSTQRQHWHHS